MKKSLLALGLLAGLCDAKFFVGASGGFLGTKTEFSSTNMAQNGSGEAVKLGDFAMDTKGGGGMMSLVLGTEHFPHTDRIGWRWELGFGAGFSLYDHLITGRNTQGALLFVELNSDMLINLYIQPQTFSVGLFLGGGIGYQSLKPSDPITEIVNPMTKEKTTLFTDKLSYLRIPIRVGLSVLWKEHHRFDLYSVLPIPYSKDHHQTEHGGSLADADLGSRTRIISSNLTLSSIEVFFGYKYVF